MAYTDSTDPAAAGCRTQQNFSASGDFDADVELTAVSHELAEGLTDPMLDLSWNDNSSNHNEVGDLCNRVNGLQLSPAGTNLNLGTSSFLVQEEWSNADNACVQTSPPNPTTDPDELQSYWVGSGNSNLYGLTYSTNGLWTGPTNVVPSAVSTPSPISPSPGVIDIFWQGGDNNLYHEFYNGGHWYGPEALTAGNPMAGPPSAVTDGLGNIHVFWAGSNGHLWQAWFEGSCWCYQDLNDGAGTLGGNPQGVYTSSGVWEIFWTGKDGNLWHKFQNLPTGQIHVFWQDSGDSGSQLWQAWYDNTTWRFEFFWGSGLQSSIPAPVYKR